MKIRVPLVISIPIIIILFIIFAVTILPWILIYVGLLFSPNPPVPEIKYGEFPFRLEYEIDGERKVIEDTLICEYDGIGFNEGTGKYIEWKEYLSSGNERVTLYKVSENIEIHYPVFNAKFYMGEIKEENNYQIFPNAILYTKKGTITSNKIIYADELYNEYKIKLLDWQYDEPINNLFS